MNPKFSIVIPFYNTPEDKFSRCIKSILSQTYSNFEVIIIDDGSTNESAAIADSLVKSDTRLRIIHKKNEGSAIARNTGIESAIGDYITFIDSDDFVSNYCLEQANEAIEESDSDLVIGLVKQFSENDNTAISALPNSSKKVTILNTRKDICCLVNHMLGYDSEQKYFYERGYIGDGPVARFCRSEIVKQAMFSPESMCSDDTVWNLKMITKCKNIAIVDDFWYAYLIFSGSKTRRFRKNCEAEVTYRIHQYYDLIESLWPECKSGLYMKIWTETFTYTCTYLFHKDNHISTREKKKQFKHFVTNPEYLQMLKNVKFSYKGSRFKLMTKRIVVFCTLYKLYTAAYFCWKYYTEHNRT